MSIKTSEAIKQMAEDIKQLILEGKSLQATASILQELSRNEHQFLTQMKKKGVLRCSSYDFQSQKLEPLIDKILSEKTLSEYARSYLESVKLLVMLGRFVQKIFKDLTQELDQGKFKSYLVSLEALFWENVDLNTINGNSKKFGLGREELASAFSFLFFQANEKSKLNENHLNDIDINKIREKYFLKKLSYFYKIIEFREIEILVDYFDYRATRRNNRIIIEAPNEKLEMSISLGYINYQNQQYASLISALIEEVESKKSLIKVSLELAVRLKNELFHIEENPSKRIVMKFPLSHEIATLISSTDTFAEEEEIIKFISRELLLDSYQIKQVNFCEKSNLSLFDIVKFQRFFVVLFYAFDAYLNSENLTKSKLFWRSILPVLKENEFLKILEHFFGKNKAIQLLELLSYNSASNKVFDVKYQPVLNISEWLIIPIGIISKSHLVRNLMQLTNYRYDADSSVTPIEKILEAALQPKSSFVERDFHYPFNAENSRNARESDIDVIVVIHNHLFVFECKNSLHPTSSFELKNNYERIQKGAEQLTRFSNLWKEEAFRDYIATKTKTKGLTKLHTCIVTGNRMFSGWKEQGHSIRTIHELQNFINSGQISAQLLDLDEKTLDIQAISLWKGNDFSAEDLVDYIENDSLHTFYFDSMIKKETEISFGNISIIQYKYVLNVAQFLQKVSSNFRLISPSN